MCTHPIGSAVSGDVTYDDPTVPRGPWLNFDPEDDWVDTDKWVRFVDEWRGVYYKHQYTGEVLHERPDYKEQREAAEYNWVTNRVCVVCCVCSVYEVCVCVCMCVYVCVYMCVLGCGLTKFQYGALAPNPGMLLRQCRGERFSDSFADLVRYGSFTGT